MAPECVPSSVLVVGVLLAGCTAAIVADEPYAFDRYEVLIEESASRPTVLTGSFLGGETAELATVSLDDDGPRVRLDAFDGAAWTMALEAPLRPGVLFVDVAEIAGRDRLLTYESGRLAWFDPDTATERVLVEVATSYNAAEAFRESPSQPALDVPRVDVTRDINRDGRVDLVVPDVDGFRVSTQSSDGSFTDPVALGPPEPFRDAVMPLMPGDPRTYGEVGITPLTNPWYQGRVHEMDADLDGRNDLVFWHRDHFDVHLQDARGRFDPVPRTFTTGVPFDSDGAYSLAMEFVGEGPGALLLGWRGKSRRTVLDSLRDVNGDGVADLMTQTLEGRNLLDQRRWFEVHFGRETPDGVRFAREVGTAIRPRGRAGGLQLSGYASQSFEDFDGDGQLDALFRDVRVGIVGMGRAMVGRSVPIDLELHRMEDGVYPGAPATVRKLRRFDPFAPMDSVFFPTVLMGDLNGDGLSDLLVGHAPEEVHVFMGVPGPDLLASQPQVVPVALAWDERNTWLVDLNGDGRQDLLTSVPPTAHAPDEPHRLTTLIARSAGGR